MWLIYFWILVIQGIISKRYDGVWHCKWMMIGVLSYLWLCGGKPVGLGSYARYRIAFYFIGLLIIAINQNANEK